MVKDEVSPDLESVAGVVQMSLLDSARAVEQRKIKKQDGLRSSFSGDVQAVVLHYGCASLGGLEDSLQTAAAAAEAQGRSLRRLFEEVPFRNFVTYVVADIPLHGLFGAMGRPVVDPGVPRYVFPANVLPQLRSKKAPSGFAWVLFSMGRIFLDDVTADALAHSKALWDGKFHPGIAPGAVPAYRAALVQLQSSMGFYLAELTSRGDAKVPINISPFRRTSVKFRVGGSAP